MLDVSFHCTGACVPMATLSSPQLNKVISMINATSDRRSNQDNGVNLFEVGFA